MFLHNVKEKLLNHSEIFRDIKNDSFMNEEDMQIEDLLEYK